MNLTVKTETSSTITLAWTPPAGVQYYLFYAAGTLVSNSPVIVKGKEKMEIRFSKTSPGPPFEVVAITRNAGTLAFDIGVYPAAPPPPPPPPPPSGEIVFDGDFDRVAVYPTSGWTGKRSGWDRTHVQGGGSWAMQQDPRVGSFMRIQLAPDTGSSRVEVYEELLDLNLGDHVFYGMAYRFPSPWQTPSSWGAMLCQLHYPYLRFHSYGLVAEGNSVDLELNTGQITTSGHQYVTDDHVIPPERFTLDEWHFLIGEITWATGPTTTRWWHRRATDTDWTKTLEKTGVATQQWCSNLSDYRQMCAPLNGGAESGIWGPMTSTGMTIDSPPVQHHGLEKFGLYAGAASHTRQVDTARFVCGTTFDIAAASVLR